MKAGPGTPASPLDTVAPPRFKANATGALVVDAQVGVDLERLAALHTRTEALHVIDESVSGLPAQAQREARRLFEQHLQYSQALTTAIGPGPEVPTLEDARQQLQVIKALRAQYFGDQAQALFGQEEALQQRLLDDAQEAMRTQSISIEEAIGQAQAKVARELGARPAGP